MATDASFLATARDALATKTAIAVAERDLEQLRERLRDARGTGLVARCVSWYDDVILIKHADRALRVLEVDVMIDIVAAAGPSAAEWAWVDKKRFQEDRDAYVRDPDVAKQLAFVWRNAQIQRTGYSVNGMLPEKLRDAFQGQSQGYGLCRQMLVECDLKESYSAYPEGSVERMAVQVLHGGGCRSNDCPPWTYDQYAGTIEILRAARERVADRLFATVNAVVRDVVDGAPDLEQQVAAKEAELAGLRARLADAQALLREAVGATGEQDDLISLLSQ